MFQIIQFLAFYIVIPLLYLLGLFFTYEVIAVAYTTAERWRHLIGVISGLLFSGAIIILDLHVRRSTQIPSEVPSVTDIIASVVLSILIGLLVSFFTNRLIRWGAVSFTLMFTTSCWVISSYYLISLSHLRNITSFGVLGFAVTVIVYNLLNLTGGSGIGLLIYLAEISGISFFYDTKMFKEVIGGNISGNVRMGDANIYIGHLEVDRATDEVMDSIGKLKNILNEIGGKFFKISVGHPKLISKGYESPFVVQLYFEELTNNVKMKIKEIVGENYAERIYDTELKFGQVVKIKLFSPDITFSEAISKKLDLSINSMTFLGEPLDTCQPREHKVVLSILDNKTGIEYQSETFSVKVADYAFDHVSRPLLSKVSALILGFGSLTMFVLALLEQIDKTIGLTSGTAAGVLAVVVYTNFYGLYQRIRANTQ